MQGETEMVITLINNINYIVINLRLGANFEYYSSYCVNSGVNAFLHDMWYKKKIKLDNALNKK